MALHTDLELDAYTIDELLARGDMGELYRARDTRLDRRVALKLLTPRLANCAEHFARFDRDARALAVLNHPNIPAIYDVGSFDGRPFVVSELLEGVTLRQRMAAGPLSVQDAVNFALQIANGLAAAHDVGVIHRDLRPGHIFVTDEGVVKILDFGLGRCRPLNFELLAGNAHATWRTLLGNIAYLSPEQARGGIADHRSDIFSLGLVLYEMVTGTLPFHGRSPAETLVALLNADLAASSTPGMNADLHRVIRNCIARDAGDRFQSARDLVLALELVDLTPGRPVGEASPSRRSLPSRVMWLT